MAGWVPAQTKLNTIKFADNVLNTL